MSYRDALLGELRLFDAFRHASPSDVSDEPPALAWTPKSTVGYHAPMLRRLQTAGAPWSMRQAFRQAERAMSRRMLAMFYHPVYEWLDDALPQADGAP